MCLVLQSLKLAVYKFYYITVHCITVGAKPLVLLKRLISCIRYGDGSYLCMLIQRLLCAVRWRHYKMLSFIKHSNCFSLSSQLKPS